ncbi:MAG: methionyl-tRNA formyltransferase [Candidatus Hatepunaea meridiana]|nr:methionyl-tRNA formyltransferase [Candidatus Hatepunaea meridiana]
MKVAFMGTPSFAVPSLKALLASRHRAVVVITGEDKRAGRSQKITETAVKRYARQFDLPILQPSDLNVPSFVRSISEFNPDICLVVAFRILPPDVFTIPSFGTINLHASLLPQLRGAAPINWALMRGYHTTGMTTFSIDKKVDTGGVLLQQQVEIHPEDDAGSLAVRLAEAGARLAVRTLDELEDGILKPVQQAGEVSYAPRITRKTCRIKWHWSAERLHNRVRGLAPSPGAFCMLGNKVVKIFKTVPHSGMVCSDAGAVIPDNASGLLVSTGEGCLEILELQLEGKRRMTVAEFIRGRPLPTGTKFN